MDYTPNETITGKVTKIMFEGSGNFCIAQIKVEEEFHDVSIKGVMKLTTSNTYEFIGSYKEDDKYGQYFAVSNYKRPELKSGEDIVNYLSSKQFEGIGKRTALKIYKAFGDETLEVIKSNPDMLLEIGINETIVEQLNDHHMADDLLSDLYKLLSKYQFSDFQIQSIYSYLDQQVQGNKIKQFVDNPYSFVAKIFGYTFAKADELYLGEGGDLKNIERLMFLLVDLVAKHCYNTGDTICLFKTAKNQFMLKTNHIIDFDLVLNAAIGRQLIIQVDDTLSTSEFYNTEFAIARNLGYRLDSIIHKFQADIILIEINKLENEFKINYSQVQKEAILNALLENVYIITGGPGTGKTTIIKAIVTIYHRLKYQDSDYKDISEKIMLTAPTGRAAQRMKETTGYQAKTIHSLLGWEPVQDKFNHNLENPLLQELFVIDEFSMVDIFLAYNLLKAIKPNAMIIIVGDKAQLESVNPGSVLGDLIDSKMIKSVHLDVIYRQGEGSTVASLARKIDVNEKIKLINTNDMSVLQRDGTIVDLVKIIYDKSLDAGYDPIDVQVLYPKYRGVNGIDNLNAVLKPTLAKGAYHVVYQDITYQVGDRIMQLKNDTARDIYNGDIGYVSKIIDPNAKGNGNYIMINIRGRDIEVTKKQMEDITHSYAISIHKSQGSEFKVVILPITRDAQNMLTKKLIYTAITRTKDKLIIIGDLNMFDFGINERDYHRNTNLKKFMLIKKQQIKSVSPMDFL